MVNLPIAADAETEGMETATFTLAAGDGYETNTDYSSGSFTLVEMWDDIPTGVVTEPNDIISVATNTGISPTNPSFSSADSIYFDIGNRYLNPDGTYTYIDSTEDVDLYQVELSAGETIAIETFDVETNPNAFGFGNDITLTVLNDEGEQLDVLEFGLPAAPDKLFGGVELADTTDSYLEFTAPNNGIYYVGVGVNPNFSYNPQTAGLGNGNRAFYGDYELAIDLLTEDNPRKTGTPTPPVSNPNVASPPTLSLTASPTTSDSEGNFTNAVVEWAEVGGISGINFTIQADGEIPEEGIEFVLNSNTNLFEYISLLGQSALPSTIGGQSLGAFYDETGTPTGIRLRIEEPIVTVNFQVANPQPWLPEYLLNKFEPLETDGAEDVQFFLESGEGYQISPDNGTADVTFYDSLADVPPPSGGDVLPVVGVTVSETNLLETEQTETTLTFTLSEPPPPEGVTIYLDSNDELVVGNPLNQFDVLSAEISGGNFPVPNGDETGFFFTITEQTATITLSAFDELTVPNIPPDAVEEGIVELTYALQPQPGYTIDPAASAINFTIADNVDSKIQVSLTASTQDDEESTSLIESEGTVGVHTFSLSAAPPQKD